MASKTIAASMLAVLALGAVLAAIPVIGTLDLGVLYGNEGWSAYHQAEAMAGQNPYPVVNRLANARDGRDLSSWFAACHFLPLLAIMIFTAATDRFPRYWRQPQAAPVIAARQDVAFLKAHAGPVLCKSLTLCYWAGKPAEADLWGYEQAVTLRQRDGHELLGAIAARRYAVLELGAPPNALAAWPEVDQVYARDIARVIAANYRIDHSDTYGTFWVRDARGMPQQFDFRQGL